MILLHQRGCLQQMPSSSSYLTQQAALWRYRLQKLEGQSLRSHDPLLGMFGAALPWGRDTTHAQQMNPLLVASLDSEEACWQCSSWVSPRWTWPPQEEGTRRESSGEAGCPARMTGKPLRLSAPSHRGRETIRSNTTVGQKRLGFFPSHFCLHMPASSANGVISSCQYTCLFAFYPVLASAHSSSGVTHLTSSSFRAAMPNAEHWGDCFPRVSPLGNLGAAKHTSSCCTASCRSWEEVVANGHEAGTAFSTQLQRV